MWGGIICSTVRIWTNNLRAHTVTSTVKLPLEPWVSSYPFVLWVEGGVVAKKQCQTLFSPISLNGIHSVSSRWNCLFFSLLAWNLLRLIKSLISNGRGWYPKNNCRIWTRNLVPFVLFICMDHQAIKAHNHTSRSILLMKIPWRLEDVLDFPWHWLL